MFNYLILQTQILQMKRIVHIIIFLFAILATSCFGSKTEIVTLNIVDFDPETKKNRVLIDVRTPKEFAEGHLPGAININVEDENFAEKMDELNKNKNIYLYCKTGKRSAKAVAIADTLGFKKIYNLDGGFIGWQEAGKAVEKASP